MESRLLPHRRLVWWGFPTTNISYFKRRAAPWPGHCLFQAKNKLESLHFTFTIVPTNRTRVIVGGKPTRACSCGLPPTSPQQISHKSSNTKPTRHPITSNFQNRFIINNKLIWFNFDIPLMFLLPPKKNVSSSLKKECISIVALVFFVCFC